MKKILFALNVFCILLFAGCSDETGIGQEDKTETTSIYGSVCDKATGEFVSNVSVNIVENKVFTTYDPDDDPIMATTWTGSDGYYEFSDIKPVTSMYLLVEHEDYKQYWKQINIRVGERTEFAVFLEKSVK